MQVRLREVTSWRWHLPFSVLSDRHNRQRQITPDSFFEHASLRSTRVHRPKAATQQRIRGCSFSQLTSRSISAPYLQMDDLVWYPKERRPLPLRPTTGAPCTESSAASAFSARPRQRHDFLHFTLTIMSLYGLHMPSFPTEPRRIMRLLVRR